MPQDAPGHPALRQGELGDFETWYPADLTPGTLRRGLGSIAPQSVRAPVAALRADM